jgi:N-acetylneuraminic acid mutarotase
MYVIGGASTAPGATNPAIHPTVAQRVLSTVEEYDPADNTWRTRSPMPTPRNHTAAGVVDGKIYVIGGRIGAAFIAASSDLANVEAYDPATDTWGRPLAKMPTARSGLDVGVYKGRIYVAGGENQDFFQHTAYHAFEAYDPATNTWSILPPMAIGRHGVAGGVVGNRFYAISGDVQSSGTGVMVSTPSADAFEFAP